jgi:membrane protease YdiL (CAAX protease family)
MSGSARSSGDGIQEATKETPAPAGLVRRAGLFLLFLACALAILLFGSNYYPAFPTNGNVAYSACLTAAFLLAALLLRRHQKTARYWPIAYAFFVASAVNLVSALFAGHYDTIVQSLGLSPDSNRSQGLQKVYEALLVATPIVVLVKLAGADLGSLLLKRGDLRWGLGIGALVLCNLITSAFIFYGTGYRPEVLGSVAVWGLVFSVSNGFLEELWFRGLFLKRLVPLIGVAGAVLLTSVWFAAIHLLGVSYMPPSVLPIFLVNTLTLGLACGILMVKTDSLWGAVLIHAGADFFLFLAMLASH